MERSAPPVRTMRETASPASSSDTRSCACYRSPSAQGRYLGRAHSRTHQRTARERVPSCRGHTRPPATWPGGSGGRRELPPARPTRRGGSLPVRQASGWRTFRGAEEGRGAPTGGWRSVQTDMRGYRLSGCPTRMVTAFRQMNNPPEQIRPQLPVRLGGAPCSGSSG
jgi:hypothetical protein